ncbi:MAG: hypothetical protein ACTSRA_00400 [Promethearchaeota archaeon]|nr:MAG: hypothetical protein [Helarchaeota virus Nidhogg Meg22_1012]URC17415.1 MAG: hypothetical protein [Helarchaeota virus Nidhogg Meg22_1214]
MSAILVRPRGGFNASNISTYFVMVPPMVALLNVTDTYHDKLKVNDLPAVSMVTIQWQSTVPPYVFNSTVNGSSMTDVDGMKIIKVGDIGVGNGVATVINSPITTEWVSL